MSNDQETTDIKFYLTSLEPGIAQTVYSQSIGGYISTSLVNLETTVASIVGLYDTTINLNTPSSGNWSDWGNIEYINIGNEIIKVDTILDGTISVIQRGVNGVTSMHLANNACTGMVTSKLFNNVFDENNKQYRCITVKNTSTNWILREGFIYIKQNSRNINSTFKIAIEIPKSNYLERTSTGWSNIQIIDTSLIGNYDSNIFTDAYLTITSGPNIGQSRIISSFDTDTGIFVLTSSLPYDYNAEYSQYVSYNIEPSPAQRIKTGTISPVVDTTYVSAFSKTEEYYPLSINILGIKHGGDLNPDNLFYIWIEHSIEKNSDLFENNNIIITIKFTGIGYS